MRRAVNPDAEVHQILSSGGAAERGVAAKRRPVVRYGQDLLSPGKHSVFANCKLASLCL